MHSELQTFDGLDNRREVMILLQRLGSDRRRAQFLEGLILKSGNGFGGIPATITDRCDPVAAYFMFVETCNTLGVSIKEAVSLLEKEVRCGGN